MKFTLVIIALFIAVSASGQALTGQASTDRIAGTDASVKELAKGEHLPLMFSGIDTLAVLGVESVTPWMPIGWSPSIAVKSHQGIIDNQALTRYDPRYFTLICELDTVSVNATDSVAIGSIIAEFAIDTTDLPIWNPDTSNALIYPSFGYNHTLYNYWTFQAYKIPWASNTEAHAYAIRVFAGAYIRFRFAGWNDTDHGSDFDQESRVKWTLIVKH